MRVLITGIDGFVGRHLSQALTHRGYEVFGTSLTQDVGSIFRADLLVTSDIQRVLMAVQPDRVFHLAGFTSVKISWDQPTVAMRVNQEGTRNLYTGLMQLKSAPRVLLTSTAEVYGTPNYLPIDEGHPTHPNNPYAESKLAQEQVTNTFPDIPTVTARSFPHIGPGQSPNFVTSTFAKQIVSIERGEKPEIFVGNLSAVRDFTDVRDVVNIYTDILEHGRAGSLYNVCSGNSNSIQSILDHLIKLSQKKNIVIRSDPDRLRQNEIPILVGSPQKLQSVIHYAFQYRLNQTLGDILQYWRSIDHF